MSKTESNKTPAKLLALPFSTEEVLQFKQMAAEEKDNLELCIPDWLSTGQLTEEIARPMVKAFEGDGVIIADHEKKTSTEIYSAISILEKFDKQLYSIKLGLTPLTEAVLKSSAGK